MGSRYARMPLAGLPRPRRTARAIVAPLVATFLLIVAAVTAEGGLGAHPRALVCTGRIVFATSLVTLRDVTALNSHHVWALGAYADPRPGTVALLHWDGRTWWVELQPRAVSEFGAFALIPPSNGSGPEVWAVGGQIHDSMHSILHWDPDSLHANGHFWSYPPGPDVGSQTVELLDVAALAGGDVWAVGWKGGAVAAPLVEHWNGGHWSVSRTPALSGDRGEFHALAAVAPNDIWILATHSYRNHRLPPVLVHWDGTGWSADEPFATVRLFSIAAVASGDAWTVGAIGNRPFIAHWDGSAWRQQPIGPARGVLDHVAAVSPTNVWASGYVRGDSSRPTVGYLPLLVHWDGHFWRAVPAPRLSRNPIVITSLRARPKGEVWAVGSTASKSVLEHFSCTNRQP